MEKINQIDEYVKSVEYYMFLMNDTITGIITSEYINLLEKSILDYLHIQAPNMVISKIELDNIIKPLYQKRNIALQKSIETSLNQTKYKSEESNLDFQKLIESEIYHLRTIFKSVESGTNWCYVGLVEACSRDVMGYIQRKKGAGIKFITNLPSARKEIEEIILKNYQELMKKMGNELIDRFVKPLEKKYCVNMTNDFENDRKKVSPR